MSWLIVRGNVDEFVAANRDNLDEYCPGFASFYWGWESPVPAWQTDILDVSRRFPTAVFETTQLVAWDGEWAQEQTVCCDGSMLYARVAILPNQV